MKNNASILKAVMFLLWVLISACRLKVVDIPNYEFQRKIEDLVQYKVTDKEKVKSFLGLDVTKDNISEISNRIKPSKLKEAKELCHDFQISIPQIWGKISKKYHLPNTWDKDSLAICKIHNGVIDTVQVKVLSYWSTPITEGDGKKSAYLKKVRQINSDDNESLQYRFRVSSTITAFLRRDGKSNITAIFFAIDCDYYLNYKLAGTKKDKITDWKAVEPGKLNYDMIQAVNQDMQTILYSEYSNK